jgi:stage II sporulation protein M
MNLHKSINISGSLNWDTINARMANLPMFLLILKNNALLAILMICGFCTFGVLNFGVIVYNGIILGSFIREGINFGGIWQTSLLILPHGIWEITWMIAASAFSLNLSHAFKQLLDSNLEDRSFLRLLFGSTSLYIILMVIIAAAIETYITPILFTTFSSM